VIDARALRRCATALGSGLRGIRTSPLIFTLSIATMAAGLLLLGAYLLVVRNMREVLASFGEDIRVIAYLEVGEPPAARRVAQLQRALSELPGVAAVRYVPPEEALVRLRADLGDQVEPEPLVRDSEQLGALAARAQGVPGVTEVRYGRDWIEGYARIVRASEWLGLALGALLAVLLASITAATVRLAVHARADDIQIQRLVGASGWFVRLPFYVEAALQGGLAAGLALGALYLLYQLGLPLLREPLGWFLGERPLSFLGGGALAGMVALGLGLGLGGALISLLRLEERV
jgi:cell division transport system permease protein